MSLGVDSGRIGNIVGEEPVVRKLIVSEFMTLDGVVEAPGGEPTHPHTNWVGHSMGEEAGTYKSDEVFEAESLLLGRVTYESFAGAWPTYEGEMADRMNNMAKHVVSTTLPDPEWNNTTVVGGDAVAAVTTLKGGDGGPILVAGSATLVRTLLAHGLVDELRLMIFPVSIGGGLRLFPDGHEKSVFELADNRTFPGGIVNLTYRLAD